MSFKECPNSTDLSDFVLGNLPGPVFDRVAHHVEHCAACETALQALDEVTDSLLCRLKQSSGTNALPSVPEEVLAEVRGMATKRGGIAALFAAGLRRLGNFELLEELGLGSFGHVFRARDTKLDRVVAIKILRAGRLATQEEVDRFLREARSAAQLKHPGLVALYETGQTEEGMFYLVEEFVQGETLADRLRTGRFGFRQAAELVAAVADALEYAHRHGVIHRDVKPSNILLDAEGRPHLMDFGLAKRETDETPMTVDGQVLGTPAYVSPEQARGEAHQVDGRTDVYSLGVILYELLTSERPFRGNRQMLLLQVLHDEPRPPRQLHDKVPRDLETICLKAMSKAPARRYATAQELADDLRHYLAGEPIRARPVGVWERAWNWAKRRPAVAALAAASALASLLLVSVLAFSYVQIAREQQQTKNALDGEMRSKEELYKALLRNAELTALAFREFNELYASLVVDRAKDHVEVTHEFETKQGAIPLPATMSMELSKRIAARGSGMQIRLYSDFPFPWRMKEGGPKDDFEREALGQLRQHPEQPFYRFEDYRGRPSLRYALASRMGTSCISCHNNRTDSPKRDWKDGDVRGVYEVIFPVDSIVAQPTAGEP